MLKSPSLTSPALPHSGAEPRHLYRQGAQSPAQQAQALPVPAGHWVFLGGRRVMPGRAHAAARGVFRVVNTGQWDSASAPHGAAGPRPPKCP